MNEYRVMLRVEFGVDSCVFEVEVVAQDEEDAEKDAIERFMSEFRIEAENIIKE